MRSAKQNVYAKNGKQESDAFNVFVYVCSLCRPWFNLDVLHYVKHVRLFCFLFSSNPQFGAHSISSSGFWNRRAIQMLFFLRAEEEKCLLFGKCLVLLLFFFSFFSCRFFCCLLLCNNQLVTVLCGLAKTVGNLLCTVYLWLILLFIRLFHV